MLHPEAALEHEEQAAYYEARANGLGRGYNAAFRSAVRTICEAPLRHRVVQAPGIRRMSLRGFPFSVICREESGVVQVLAIAPYRKRPGYWSERL
ncbi:MAG: type II toxin-antitoxin system RelE/ParE family toxin [Bryobacteraceae bacterium]